MDYRTTCWPKCRAEHCLNPGRYDSGYCALCDIEFNDAMGQKKPPTLPATCSKCGGELGEKYFQGVPGLGDLCLVCHGLFF